MADMSEFTQLQNAHMEAILGSDSEEPFLTFISNLSSDSEEEVSEAKSMFEMIKDKDPESFATKLSNYLAGPGDVYTREECAKHLCKLLTDEHLFTWHNRLSVSTQSSIKSILLNRIKLEQDSDFIIKELRYTIYKLSLSMLPDNNWPELLPILFHYLIYSTSSNYLKQSVFWIFAELATHIGKTLVHCVIPLHSLFLTTLNDHTLDLDLRIQATRAVLKFIQHVPVTSNEKERFQKLLPGMMRTLTDTLSNCGKAKVVQEHFIDLAKEDPKFFRLQLRDVVHSMLEIAKDEKLENKTRHMAVEFVLTLVEARKKAPGMMKRLPLFTHTCFAVLLNLLLDIKDESSCHTGDTNLDGAGLTDNLIFGRRSLNRFSIALGGKTIAHVAMEQLGEYLVDPEWEKRHAALDALYYIAEGSSKVLIKYLQQLIDMVLLSFQDPHPQVKWAAIRAIRRFSVDFCPVFQEQYHNQILPTLAEAMDDSKDARVQELAALAVYEFCRSRKPQTLVPYLDELLNKLLVLLQSDNQIVLKAAVRALGYIVFVLRGRFQKYYDVVVPHVKTILVNVNNKSNHSLLRCALECISQVAVAVGKEKFRDDLKQVMEMLQLLQESQVKELHTFVYILTAYRRICISMGKDFLPYMKIVIPTLVECAQLEPDKTLSSYEVNKSMHKVKIGDGIIYVRGSKILSAKSKACYLLGAFAFTLKEDFYPWISQAASILVPLLKFSIHDKVREETSFAMYRLLHSAKLAIEKGTTQGVNLSYFKQLSDDIIMALGDALYSEPDTKICALILRDLNCCLKICGPLLDEDQIGRIIDGVNYVMKESSQRKGELAERAKSEDFDDEDAELMREEKEQEVDVFRNVGGILLTFIKAFKACFLPFLDKLSLYLMLVRGEEKAVGERKTCILIFCYIVEHCGESAIKYYKIYLPFLLEMSNDESPAVRRAALFGLGLCAEYGGYSFKPSIGEALSRINAILTHCNALEPENVMAYNNAVSTLGKICQFHQESVESRQMIPVWLNCLPIKEILAEAKVVHDQLCSMVERSDEELWGYNYLHLPKVISVFTEVLCAGDNLATLKTSKCMINLLRNFKQTLPQATWASTWPLLLPQQVMELESILSGEDDLNISTCYETTSLENM